jgi:hypothetical protein
MAPMKDKILFIVTSALNADMGVISRNDRLDQTMKGLISIRKYVPDAIILLADGSPQQVEPEKLKILSHFANFAADFSTDAQISELAVNHRKSEAENLLLLKTLMLLKQDEGMKEIMSHVGRIVKISARTDLTDGFDIEEHMVEGKYVFKKRMPTWLTDSRNEFATDLLITRMFSFCPTLMDDYMKLCETNIALVLQTRIDTEHAHFVNINKDLLVELDEIHCTGIVAGTGTVENY